MVANADVEKAQIPQQILGGLNHLKLLLGDGFAVGNARTEAGHLGFIRRGKSKTGGKSADFGLGEAGFLEGGADLKFGRSLGSGAKIADVAGVFTVGEDGKLELAGDGEELSEEFVLTEVAAVQWVRFVVGVVEFGCGDDPDRKMELGCDFESFGQFTPGKAGGISNYGQSAVSQNVVGEEGQEH